tara:strand:- start:3750 stop:4235 length:486 start_codon:yes stop_codon:yes gene_type:complete
MAKNNNGRSLLVFAVVAILVLIFFNCMGGRQVSNYAVVGDEVETPSTGYAPVSMDGNRINIGACALKEGGTGLASALLPREVATQEDFNQFAPSEILKGQNFLDPRNQIGFPETIGGALRNANQQVRSEPANPRNPVSIFNTSTIPPDQMRPAFEIGQGAE